MKKHLLILLLLSASMRLISQTFNCGDTLIDTRDGQKYPTVQIGTACWMKKNLNYGTQVSSFTSTTMHNDMSNNSIVEKYAYNNSSANLLNYGGLYEWDELMNYTAAQGGQGICPNGWHVPTDAEWQTMITAAGGTLITPNGGYGGNKLKNIGEGFGAGAGTNTSGFSAKHGGDRDAFGIFYGLTFRSIFWTSTTNGSGAYQYSLWADRDTIFRGGNALKETGFSCRCVKNTNTGINRKMDNQIGFNVYPNPVKDMFALVITTNYDNAEFSLFTIIGEQVLTGKISSTTTKISTEDLPSGLYILKVRSGNEVFEKKIVISK